jgi:hypothetical protein
MRTSDKFKTVQARSRRDNALKVDRLLHCPATALNVLRWSELVAESSWRFRCWAILLLIGACLFALSPTNRIGYGANCPDYDPNIGKLRHSKHWPEHGLREAVLHNC